MAAPGRGEATLLDYDGYDPYRAYCEDPQAGGWRELRSPLTGQRYWQHVAARITTWSLAELLRLNGLEEFLLLGEWGVFATVPEDVKTYEDLDWGLPLYKNDRLSGRPVGKLDRGTVVVTLGFARPGVVELMLPCEGKIVETFFAPLRSANRRLLQRLPVRMHNEDLVATAAVTVPLFRVRPDQEAVERGEGDRSALLVTLDRDPRSEEVGVIQAGTLVGLSSVLGTRAQIARVKDGSHHLVGGWISFLLLDGTPTLDRVMEETENMKLAQQLKDHLAELDAQRAIAIANGEDPDEIRPRSSKTPAAEAAEGEAKRGKVDARSTEAPPVRAKNQIPYGQAQRWTVSGGWRQVLDRAWNRPIYVEPLAGRLTWGFLEVVRSAGLDDLLLARHWELCVVDPIAIEDQKDKTWCMKVFSDTSMSGQPIAQLPKGTVVVVQVFHKNTKIAMIMLPPPKDGGDPSIGYAFYRKHDNRSILRSILPQGEVDTGVGIAAEEERPDIVKQSELGFPDTPEDGRLILEGPWYVTPPDGVDEIQVGIGQDVESDQWTKLPRGYCVQEFAEVLGFRARLRDIEGGGWVNFVSPEGQPNFWKQPIIPPKSPEVKILEAQEQTLPIVWPTLGVLRPPKPVPVKEEFPVELPAILQRMGGGRAICDWNRRALPLFGNGHVWRNPLTGQQALLDDLLRNEIWKLGVVVAESVALRERSDPLSKQVGTIPRGSLVIAEWVGAGATLRLLYPGKANDERPLHVWTELASASGPTITPLPFSPDLWIEPHGGHLPVEEQGPPDGEKDRARISIRKERDPESAVVGDFRRGDGIQVAEIIGRSARVVMTKQAVEGGKRSGAGWIDLVDESGWFVVRTRNPGEIHPVEQAELDLAARLKDIDRQVKETLEKERAARAALDAAREEALKEETGVKVEELSAEAASELPTLLWQLGELEVKSIWTRDWREHIDPVWGQRYYVNRWSGQIIHRLANFGVACPAVRLTAWFDNLSFDGVRKDSRDAEEAEDRMLTVEKALLGPMASLADVDEDRVQVQIEEDEGEEYEDSISGELVHDQETRNFRVIVTVRAPGVRASWASGVLKQEMANAEGFSRKMISLMTTSPDFIKMRVDPYGDISLIQADLEELDLPRDAKIFEPPPPPMPPPPLPVATEFAEIQRSYSWTRQTILHFHRKEMTLGDSQALAEGLGKALPEPVLEELGMWQCRIGDEGSFAIAKALDAGVGANLHTLLLDENSISAAGAKALGAGLKWCGKLRELCVSKNPLGKGFASLLSGLGPGLVLLDASEAQIDDSGAAAVASKMKFWPALTSLRLFGNASIGPLGCESVARALLGAPNLKMADLKGAQIGLEWPRLKKMLQDGGVALSRVRFN